MGLGPLSCCPGEPLSPWNTRNQLDSGPLGGPAVSAGGLCTGWV